MNIAKIQSDLLLFIIEKKRGKNFTYGLSENGQYVVVCADGIVMYLIKTEDFKIDLTKCDIPSFQPDRFMRLSGKAKTAALTNDMKFLPQYKKTVVKIMNENEYAWVDEKYLKMFDKVSGFRIINKKSPVFIYENDELVGMLSPVYVNGGSD